MNLGSVREFFELCWLILLALIKLPLNGIIWLFKNKHIRIFIFCMALFLGSVEFVTLDLQNVLYWGKEDKMGLALVTILIILGSVFGPKMD